MIFDQNSKKCTVITEKFSSCECVINGEAIEGLSTFFVEMFAYTAIHAFYL